LAFPVADGSGSTAHDRRPASRRAPSIASASSRAPEHERDGRLRSPAVRDPQIPIGALAERSPYLPAVSSLGGFRAPAPDQSPPSQRTGTRNPSPERKFFRKSGPAVIRRKAEIPGSRASHMSINTREPGHERPPQSKSRIKPGAGRQSSPLPLGGRARPRLDTTAFVDEVNRALSSRVIEIRPYRGSINRSGAA
jgi:hypothetical protein